jgi:predicted permease
VGDLIQDIRYAVRLLVKQPAFAVVTIVVLALGIGATTAIFSVVDAVLLRSLPYADAGRLVLIQTFWKRAGLPSPNVSAPDFHDWHREAVSFDGMAAYFGGRQSVTIGDTADYAVVTIATPDLFPVLSARAALGRLPSSDEQQPGGTLAVVVSDAFWRSHLGADRTAVGRRLKYQDRLYTIVGVLEPGFRFPTGTDVFAPWWPNRENPSRGSHNYRVVARLKSGVTIEQAQAEMTAIAARLEQAYPRTNDTKSAEVDPLQEQYAGAVRSTLTLIFGVVLIVLLIACANVSNLLLARAQDRTRELGVRVAIGATRGRMMQQLITESVLLAAVAGILGVLIAAWGIRGLIAMAPQGLPRLDEVRVDGRLLGFALLLSLGTSVVFSLVPALRASRVDVNEVLKQTGRGARGGSGRLRATLIVFETAAAVVLVVTAALLVRSYDALNGLEAGFRTDHLLLADTTVPFTDLESARRAVRFYRAITPQLAAIPGVQSAAAVSSVPTQERSNGGYAIEGGPTFEQMLTNVPQAWFLVASPKYIETIGMPLVRGRDFAESDVEGAPLVAIVNQAFARKAFPGQDALGRRLISSLDQATNPDGSRYTTIVGVVADVIASDPTRPAWPQLFTPFAQHPYAATTMTLVIRTEADAGAIAAAVAQRVRALDADVPVRLGTMTETMSAAMAVPRFRTTLVGLFAGLALTLAMVGVYGLVSFSVAQRTSELGLRMALGAQRAEIVRLTLSDGLRLAVLGVVIGWPVALVLSRVLSSLLFQVTPRDPVAFGVAPALLLAAAGAASLWPALRASRVDPAIALRVE